MKPPLDPGIVTLLGSGTRPAALGVLANAGEPVTAYRVAKMIGAEKIKVTKELARLRAGGFVDRRPLAGGRFGWVLVNDALRSLLRSRVRIVRVEDLVRRQPGRLSPRGRSIRLDRRRFPSNPASVPNPGEFLRPPEKDQALTAAGLKPTRRR